MTLPEIECLISEAISNRPKVTNAPMSLYIYDGKLICGARIVMPTDAAFVAHVPTDRLQNGFSNKEWKLIVEKVGNILGTVELADNTTEIQTGMGPNEFQRQIKANQTKFNERRREQRLYYRRPIWFAEDLKKKLSRGQMLDVSSRGMAFTCCTDESCLHSGQQIAARFSVPRFNSDDSIDTVSFDRIGSICRVDDVNKSLRRIAIQFAEPLPFKPGEQVSSESEAQQRLKAITI